MNNFEIRNNYKYEIDELVKLYESVGWKKYAENPEMLMEAYSHSLYSASAFVNKELVGIIRLVGDGCTIAYIQDLLVHPDYQNKGIGTALIQNALEKYQHVNQIVLLTDNQENTVHFYKKAGFTQDHEMGCCAFVKFKGE